MNKYYIFCITFFVLIFLPSVYAQPLFVSSQVNNLDFVKGQTGIFTLRLFNNNSFEVQSVNFSNVPGLSFPSISSILPFSYYNVSYSGYYANIFSGQFVSTLSFLTAIPFNVSSNSYVVNVSCSSIFPSNLSIVENDSVTFVSLCNESMILKDLSSGWSQVVLGNMSSVTQTFYGVGNFSFYNFPFGFTGHLSVGNKSNFVFSHVSSDDVPIVFNVRSFYAQSTLSLHLLTSSLSSNNNQSQQGIIEVKNADNQPLYHVYLTDSRGWVSFPVNNFTLNGLENKIVFFNITPFVTRTNDTNTSLQVVFSASADNSLFANTSGSMFVSYQDFDSVNINGTNYILNVLGFNQTIEACRQHFGEVGYERCQDLKDWARTNVTIIKEIPAVVTVTEDEARAGWRSIVDVNSKTERLENTMNRQIDYFDSLIPVVQNNSNDISELKKWANFRDMQNSNAVSSINNFFRGWLYSGLAILVVGLIITFVKWSMWYNVRKRALQE